MAEKDLDDAIETFGRDHGQMKMAEVLAKWLVAWSEQAGSDLSAVGGDAWRLLIVKTA